MGSVRPGRRAKQNLKKPITFGGRGWLVGGVAPVVGITGRARIG